MNRTRGGAANPPGGQHLGRAVAIKAGDHDPNVQILQPHLPSPAAWIVRAKPSRPSVPVVDHRYGHRMSAGGRARSVRLPSKKRGGRSGSKKLRQAGIYEDTITMFLGHWRPHLRTTESYGEFNPAYLSDASTALDGWFVGLPRLCVRPMFAPGAPKLLPSGNIGPLTFSGRTTGKV